MKKTTTPISSLCLLALMATTLFHSCKKDDNSTTPAITDDETTEAITEAVTGSSGGLSIQAETMATTVPSSMASISCGSSKDTTIAQSSTTGATLSYTYSMSLYRSLTCTNGIPSMLSLGLSGKNTYATPRMSSSDSSEGQMVITQIQSSYSNYLLNGSYIRNGSQQSLVGQDRTLKTAITFTVSGITISKSSNKILSGTAAIQFTGSTSGAKASSRGGTLTFLGNNQASLILDNGTAATIQW